MSSLGSLPPAGSAIILSSHRTVELLTAQQTRDVYEILAQSAEHGVNFQFRVPVGLQTPRAAGPNAASILQTADAIAVQLDDLFTFPNVVDVQYVQDVSPSNQLLDLVEIFVQSDNGQATDFLRWPLETVDLRVLGAPLQALVDRLNTLVGTAPPPAPTVPSSATGGVAGGAGG